MSLFSILRSLQRLPVKGTPLCACKQIKLFSAKAPVQKIVKEIDPNTGEIKRKKTAVIPKITLLSSDESINITTLIEAEKIAKRRDLKLVKIVDVDTKTQRPVYKLMTGAEYHAEDLKQRELHKKERQNTFIKGEKVLLINSKISQHDLETQIKKSLKWIEKSYEVRIVISSSSQNMESAVSFWNFQFNFC